VKITGALIFVFFMMSDGTHAQHLRIYACAIANDSAGASLGASSNGSGLYQSDDTGKTWKHLGWDNIKCYSMDMVQSSNGRILYEATGLGILRSTDYGEHWKQITDWRISEAMDVAVNQKNPNEIYIATAHGPWRSGDGGKSWEALLDGLPVPYTSRIVIDSVIQNHILVASEAGIFSLSGDNWKKIPCEQRNIQNEIEKNAAGIYCIAQISPRRWIAASGNSRELISSDSGKSFGTRSFGADSLWTVCEISDVHERGLSVMGGANGSSSLTYNSDLVYQGYDNDQKFVSAIMPVIFPFNEIYMRGLIPDCMYATLGRGIYFEKKNALLNRQIWTLKSFLVTP
jgi:hypothetical protein